MNERKTFRAKIDHVGHGTIQIADGENVMDISDCVSAFTVKADMRGPTVVEVKLLAMQLELDLPTNIILGDS